jgi:hypothetical protein
MRLREQDIPYAGRILTVNLWVIDPGAMPRPGPDG